MSELSASQKAGKTLRRLIKENYSSQEEFAFEYGADVRTISRYVNNGIRDTDKIQEFALHFHVNFFDFLKSDTTKTVLQIFKLKLYYILKGTKSSL